VTQTCGGAAECGQPPRNEQAFLFAQRLANALSSIRVQIGTWDFFIDDNYVLPPNRGMADILDEAREPPSPGVARGDQAGKMMLPYRLAAHDRLRHGGGNEALIDEVAAPRLPRQKYLNCEQYCTYGWRRIAFNQPALRMAAVAGRPDPGSIPSPPRPGVPLRALLGERVFDARNRQVVR
jgi:hypothetical protein